MEKENCTSHINLLETIETIIEIVEKSKLDEVLMQKAEPHLQALAQELNISQNQALLFSAITNFSTGRRVSIAYLSRFFDCRDIKLLRMKSDFDALKARKLIVIKRDEDGDETYVISKDALLSLQKNEVYEVCKEKEDIQTLSDWFDTINELLPNSDDRSRFFSREKSTTEFELMTEEIENLIEDYPQFEFVKQLKRVDLSTFDTLLFLAICQLFIYNNDDNILPSDLENVFPRSERRKLRNFFKNRNVLFDIDFVEFTGDDTVSQPSAVKLTNFVKETMLAELELNTKKRRKDIISSETIVEKPLFYNEKEGKQVAELQKLLSQEYFKTVQERMKEKGMPQGFSCLFYGSPGTGKTESALQLAKQSGRDIYMVDIAATKSMWFGESEKKIKEIFVRYKEMVKNSQITPILLFNEADAVFGKRKDTASGNCAQTENAIQNIILQEMETLNGILIATTNLTNNLDAAFERRFVYKIKFEKPSVLAKQKIWQSKLPTLNEDDSMRLANNFDFSGGEIDNIVRKSTINEIIFGENPQFSDLEKLCTDEKITARPSVGFR